MTRYSRVGNVYTPEKRKKPDLTLLKLILLFLGFMIVCAASIFGYWWFQDLTATPAQAARIDMHITPTPRTDAHITPTSSAEIVPTKTEPPTDTPYPTLTHTPAPSNLVITAIEYVEVEYIVYATVIVTTTPRPTQTARVITATPNATQEQAQFMERVEKSRTIRGEVIMWGIAVIVGLWFIMLAVRAIWLTIKHWLNSRPVQEDTEETIDDITDRVRNIPINDWRDNTTAEPTLLELAKIREYIEANTGWTHKKIEEHVYGFNGGAAYYKVHKALVFLGLMGDE